MCLVVTSVLLLRTRSPPGLRLPKKIGDTHPRNHNLWVRKYMYIFFFNSRNYIINWMTMTKKSGKHSMWHTEPQGSCFDLIKSYQQHILCTPPLEIEPVTTEYRAKTLPLSYWFTLHTSNAKLTTHGKCAAIKPYVSCSYADVYLQSSSEDEALEMTVFSVRGQISYETWYAWQGL